MVIRSGKVFSSETASLLTELLVGMAIVVGVMIPLAWSLTSERRLARSLYERAVAMEIVDSELELVLAGEWKAYKEGQQVYEVRAAAVNNLSPGKFLLTVNSNRVRLEWRPEAKRHGGAVIREGAVQ